MAVITNSRPSTQKYSRLLGLLLLFAFFFLPLHGHPHQGTAQVTKECACIHGSRSEMGLPPPAVSPAPLFIEFAHHFLEPQFSSYETSSFGSIRAPPAS
jgi:hypothetical protein